MDTEKLNELLYKFRQLNADKGEFTMGMAGLKAEVVPTDDPRAVELHALKLQAGETLLAAVNLEIAILNDAINAELNK